MTKIRPARPTNPATRRANASRRRGKMRMKRSWLLTSSVLLAFIVVGALWLIVPSLRNEDPSTGSEVQSIATLDAPDFHSLLIDPTNLDHVMFGSHAGIQESWDGGFTWKNGSLRNADAMSLAVSPNEPSTIFVAGHDVFQVSNDGGKTWQAMRHDLPGTDIHGFAQDPSDPQRLFAFVVGAGIFTSTDGGTTWRPIPSQPPDESNHPALAVNEIGLFASTATGLVISRDGGATWTALPGETGGVISLATVATEPNLLYAGTPSGLVRSDNGGQSWAPIGPQGVIVITAVTVAPSDPNRVWFLTQTGDLYRSDDGGTTWRQPR